MEAYSTGKGLVPGDVDILLVNLDMPHLFKDGVFRVIVENSQNPAEYVS
jgi:hypothetical protein